MYLKGYIGNAESVPDILKAAKKIFSSDRGDVILDTAIIEQNKNFVQLRGAQNAILRDIRRAF